MTLRSLTPLNFDGSLTPDQIMQLGREIVRTTIALVDRDGVPTPFCKTVDGRWVHFRSLPDKLIGEEDALGFRPISSPRVRRLHWIIPILTQETTEKILRVERLGSQINRKCTPDWTYRIYFLPKQMYTVWLYYPPEKRTRSSLNLISAYRIDRQDTRRLFEKLFP